MAVAKFYLSRERIDSLGSLVGATLRLGTLRVCPLSGGDLPVGVVTSAMGGD